MKLAPALARNPGSNNDLWERLFLHSQTILAQFQHAARTPLAVLQGIVGETVREQRLDTEELEDGRYAVRYLRELFDEICALELPLPLQREWIRFEEIAPLLGESTPTAAASTPIFADKRWIRQGARVAWWALELDTCRNFQGFSCSVASHKEGSSSLDFSTNKRAQAVWAFAVSIFEASGACVSLDPDGRICLIFSDKGVA